MRCRQCGWPYGIGQDGLCANCRDLSKNPDALSKRQSIMWGLKKVPFQDLKNLDESQRTDSIAKFLNENPGKQVAVMVDCGEGHADKGDRYIKAVREKAPGVKVVSRNPGPVQDCETIMFQK